MAFDLKKFSATNFVPRTASVPVPDMAAFFGDDPKKAVWKIRGLTGQEVGKCRETVEKNKKLSAVLEGIASEVPTKVKSAISDFVGGDRVADEVARRMEMVAIGSVDPKIDMEIAIKLCKVYPIEFWTIASRIDQLTAAGHIPGKARPSGKTPKSGTH